MATKQKKKKALWGSYDLPPNALQLMYTWDWNPGLKNFGTSFCALIFFIFNGIIISYSYYEDWVNTCKGLNTVPGT